MAERQMKNSGIEWLNKIPNDWEIKRLKHIKSKDKYSIVDGPFGTAISTDDYVDEGIPLVRITNLKTPYVVNENLVFITKEHASELQRSRLNLGDIVFAKTGATIGKCAVNNSIDYGILSSSCVKIALDKACSNKYYYYQFFTDQFNKSLKDACVGTTRDTINLIPFSNLKVCVPPQEEQTRIANFLDKKIFEIDNAIEKTKQSIEEYKKLKKSIITEAVTKGLNPDVEMKDSGIEWIGEIPSKWIIQKFKRLGKCKNGLTYSPENQCGEEGTLVLRSSNIQEGKLDFNDCVYVDIDVPEELMVKAGDILICSRNGSAKLIGKNVIIPEELRASFGAFMMIYRCNEPKYLQYILSSHIFNYYLGSFLTVSVNQLTGSSFENIQFPYTSDKAEQEQIVSYLDKQCSKFDNLISNKEKVVEELEQYKKSLIYEYVTGKREVA